MDHQSDKITTFPSTTCTFKRSFVKVSSQEFNNGNLMPSTHSNRNSIDLNARIYEITNRPKSPLSCFRLKFCDNSSGYGSSTSFSSTLHSMQKTPSMQSISQPPRQLTIKKTDRPNKAQTVRDSITNVLDQIDKRVAFMRETALELEEEKKKLYKVLNSIITCEELNAIAEVDQEEIKVTTHGLLYRLNSVDVILSTPRSESQQKALENVNLFLEKLSDAMKVNRETAKQTCQSYLSACSSDQFKSIPVDDKFQNIIIQCAVDDQKKIRKSLESILSTMSKLEVS